MEIINQYNKFENIPEILSKYDISNELQNMVRNRYSNIFPYDETRVLLQYNTSDNDYINANFIFNHNYIATQAPLILPENTVSHFWKMIYDNDSKIIINLTNNIEYLDPKHNISKEITVKIITSNLYDGAKYIILTKNKKSIVVPHLTFSKWPDKNVPLMEDFIQFYQYINTFINNNSKGPIVVHCLAGIGRTGTFIAIDYILRNRIYNYNIINLIYEMRTYRMKMVQTKKQFNFILKTLDEFNKSKKKIQNNRLKLISSENNDMLEQNEITKSNCEQCLVTLRTKSCAVKRKYLVSSTEIESH